MCVHTSVWLSSSLYQYGGDLLQQHFRWDQDYYADIIYIIICLDFVKKWISKCETGELGDQLPKPLVFQILTQADFFQWLPIVRKFGYIIYEMMTVIIIDCKLIQMMMIMRIDDWDEAWNDDKANVDDMLDLDENNENANDMSYLNNDDYDEAWDNDNENADDMLDWQAVLSTGVIRSPIMAAPEHSRHITMMMMMMMMTMMMIDYFQLFSSTFYSGQRLRKCVLV